MSNRPRRVHKAGEPSSETGSDEDEEDGQEGEESDEEEDSEEEGTAKVGQAQRQG